MKKMWGGRFNGSVDELMEEFNASINFDKILYREDIEGSMAHAKMLAVIGILNEKELNEIIGGLEKIQLEFESGQFKISLADEDIHMAIEKRLTVLVGEVGRKLHTARSRNDQVITDVRLYTKKAINQHKKLLLDLLKTFLDLAKNYRDVILPGHTHLQAAQPITLSFYFLSYFFMFKRDFERFQDVWKRTDVNPLGSGAFAGVNYPIDRELTTKSLGFGKMTENAMDAVSDRDFIIDYLSSSSILSMHLSRINEEFIIWSNKLFDFVEMDDQFATGSSIMPNKKNPDACELLRGKTGRIYGHLMGILTTMKALPLSYNKDLQEDKEGLFDTVYHINISLQIMIKVLETTKFKVKNMRDACEKGFLQATDIADYLVVKGVPFRDAHHVSGMLVKYCEHHSKTLTDLTLKEFKEHHPLFLEDIFDKIKLENLINNKKSAGSTSDESVEKQIHQAQVFLKEVV